MSFTPLSRRQGRISYRKASTGDAWGMEDWSFTRDHDGNRTLVAHCEMELDGRHVVRDSTLAVDPGFQPLDAYVRILNHGRFTGSGWFRFEDGYALGESWTDEKGRISQREEIDRPTRGFGIHALLGDGWLAASYPLEKGAGSEHFWGRNPVHSLDHLGATGPEIEVSTSGFRYKGIEDITVPAGTFNCHRFEMVGIVNDHPPYDFWLTSDGDFIYVRGTVAGYMDGLFELEELRE
ncbi:hypothetical protein [Altererythrobacter sp. MF3-039]|uniref:hypothetical protein n=1 Tax=Altererythrobacter sp. MF3-039 TaxID=3252901 RepID=UPI00390C91AE